MASRLDLLLSWGRYVCFLGGEPWSSVSFQVMVAVGHYLIHFYEIWAMSAQHPPSYQPAEYYLSFAREVLRYPPRHLGYGQVLLTK